VQDLSSHHPELYTTRQIVGLYRYSYSEPDTGTPGGIRKIQMLFDQAARNKAVTKIIKLDQTVANIPPDI